MSDWLALIAALTGPLGKVWEFFAVGGIFMGPLVLTSVVALAAIVFKARTLRRSRIVPRELETLLEKMGRRGAAGTGLETVFREAKSRRNVLARLCMVAIEHPSDDAEDMVKAVQSSAREEIVKMHLGMPLLETVITAAPMLGLLGTASGLVLIFNGIGATSDYYMTSRGISEALNNTIMGLAIALPCVVAHSHYERKMERFIARMEVLTGHLIAAVKAARKQPDSPNA